MDAEMKLAVFAGAGGIIEISPGDPPCLSPHIEIKAAARDGQFSAGELWVSSRAIEVTYCDGRNYLIEAIGECIDELSEKCPALRRAGLAPPTPAEIVGE